MSKQQDSQGAASTELRCRNCLVHLDWAGTGRPPKWCDRCHPRRDRTPKARQEKKDGTYVPAYDRKPKPQSEDIPGEWRSRLLAAMMAIETDPAKAARLAGVESAADLAAIVEEASKHRDITERRPAAIGALLSAAIATGAIRLAASMRGVPPSQLPTAIRALSQALELIQGTTQPAYSQIVLKIVNPDGTEYQAAPGAIVA